MHWHRVALWVLLVSAVVACDRRRVLASDVTLGPRATEFTLAPPLEVPGPSQELCVTVTEPDGVPTDISSGLESTTVRTRDGRRVRLAARLTDTDGRSEAPSIGTVIWGGPNDQVCFHPSPAGRPYPRVQIWADGPVRVSEITWFSGQHHAWVP